MNLPEPFEIFKSEYNPGEYKDFGLDNDDPYPLKGVTYPTHYGEIEGFIAEDGANLDVFVGSDPNGYCGYIVVKRPDTEDGEHKVYLQVTEDEESKIGYEFRKVLKSLVRLSNTDELIDFIQKFKK